MLDESKLFEKINKIHKDLLINPYDLEPYLTNFNEEKKDLFDPEKFRDSRILVTGVTGFVGSHLTAKLLEIDVNAEIYGLVRRHSVPYYPNIKDIKDKITLEEGNLTDYPSIERIIKKIEPDYIFHLAAQSFVPTSFYVPIESIQTNIEGTVNILEAIRNTEISLEGIQVACSSEEYGLVYHNEVPIKETNPLRPQSPYASSKVAAEMYSLQYERAFGIPVKITRGFNHTGPKRGHTFVTSVISSQIANIIKKRTKKIILGNIKPIRDFTNIKDMLQGYILAITKGKKGEVYNLGHGFGISIENLVKLTASLFDVEYEIVIDKNRFRPAEVNVLICDYSKAKENLGYYPQYPLTETMKDLVNYYLQENNLFNR